MSRVNHQDLGQLNGPIVLFGGPYSNLQALYALFDRARALGVGPDRMICTGDVVAYCADAHAVSGRMQDSGIAVVAGNCEKQLAAGAMDCGCGFEDGSACDLLSVAGTATPAHRSPKRSATGWGRCRISSAFTTPESAMP